MFLAYASVLCADEIDEAIANLSHEEVGVRQKAIALLTKRQDKAIPRLYRMFFPDISEKLKELGHEKYQVRKNATRHLINIGAQCQTQVEAFRKTSNDPEVTYRCDRVLKAIGDGERIPADRAMVFLGAVQVLLGSETNPADERSRVFYGEYLRNQSYLADSHLHTIKTLLNVIGKDKAYLPSVRKAVGLTESREVFAALADSVLRLDATQAVEILEPFKDKRYAREKVGVVIAEIQIVDSRDPFLLKIQELKRSDHPDFLAHLKLAPSFKEVFKNDVKTFLESKNLAANALGLKLIGDEADVFLPRVIEIVKSVKSSDRSWEFFRQLEKVDFSRQQLKKHINVFLDCHRSGGIRFALELIKDDAPKYFDRLLALLSGPAHDGYISVADFLLKNLPDRKDKIQDVVVKQIKLQTMENHEGFSNLAHILRYSMDYKGHDFDEWWTSQMTKAKDSNNKSWQSDLFYRFVNLNVKGQLVLPHLDLKEDWWCDRESIKCLLAGTQEHKQKVIGIVKRRFNQADDAHESMQMLGILIDEKPDLFQRLHVRYLTVLTKDVKEEQRCLNDTRYTDVIGEFLREHPGHTDAYLSQMAGETPYRDATALACMRGVRLNEQQRKIVLRTIDRTMSQISEWLLLYHLALSALENGAERSTVHSLILKLYKLPQSDDNTHYISKLAYAVDARDQPLAKSLQQQFDSLGFGHKILACFTILNINPKNRFAVRYLADIARNDKDIGRATGAVGMLGIHDQAPLLDNERFDFFYTDKDKVYSINHALGHSPKNAIQASGAIVRHMNTIAASNHSVLGRLIWKIPELQKRITPSLMKLLETGNLKERKFASNIIASAGHAMPAHVDELLGIFEIEKNQGVLKNLLWAIANIGTDAAPLVQPIKARLGNTTGIMQARSYFALSRISPDRKERLKYVKLLLSLHHESGPKNLKRSIVRMLGLVKEFEDVIHPFLFDVMFNEKLSDYERSEAVWGLARTEPFTRYAREGFKKVLDGCVTPEGYEKHAHIVSGVVWGIRQHPSSSYQLLPLLDKLPLNERMERSFRLTRKALFEESKRQLKDAGSR